MPSLNFPEKQQSWKNSAFLCCSDFKDRTGTSGRGSALVPLTEDNDIENANSGNAGGIRGFFARIADFFRNIIEKIKSFFTFG